MAKNEKGNRTHTVTSTPGVFKGKILMVNGSLRQYVALHQELRMICGAVDVK